MAIILAEEGTGGQPAERSFEKEVILFGRDANECDLPFDNAKYPMVSRRHAELRAQGGQWLLVDLNSSYGTFLDGKRVAAPQPVKAGSVIQFGVDGPKVNVVWFEVFSDPASAFWPGGAGQSPSSYVPAAPVAAPPSAAPPSAAPPVAIAAPPQQQQMPSTPPRPAPVEVPQRNAQQPTDPARLEFVSRPGRPPYLLSKPNVWLGRDPSCDVIFDASAGTVSRRHAEIRHEGEDLVIADNKSFNGTLVNGQRITAAIPIYHGDEIQLGVAGPVIRIDAPARIAPVGASLAGQRSVQGLDAGGLGSKTVVFQVDRPSAKSLNDSAGAQLLMSLPLEAGRPLTVGRDETSDIKLDGLQISKRHARLSLAGGNVTVEDLNSTNGVYVNGERVTKRQIGPADAVQVGSFQLRVDIAGNVGVFDTRSKFRIDAAGLSKEARSRSAGGAIKLLDSISLSIKPNEFVGMLGPSGSGKSTLMDALNGVRPVKNGSVRINGIDLYRHFDALKQSIGYVPQDDIIHRELSVYRTLYYVAKLRLSRDVSRAEIRQIIDEVLDVTNLADRRDVSVRRLSGGQRKRVSIAVELITKPSVIFLDEPTSGLDPAAETRTMRLFKQIADSGRTVVMTTHNLENVRLFDKVILLMRGRLVYYGPPDEALKHFGVEGFKELYEQLDHPLPVDGSTGEAERRQAMERAAEEFKQKYISSKEFRELVERPLSDLKETGAAGRHKKRRLGLFGAIGQWVTLSRRYMQVLLKDKLTLLILFAQAPVIAMMTFFAMGSNQPRDFVYFVLALVAIWFGTSLSAREIIREKPVYRRERMFNLGILPYLGSKLFVLSLIVGLQCMMMFVPLKIFDLVGLMPMPGEFLGLPQVWAMLLTAGVGIALGLFVSALVRTSEMATSIVPLLLIPQLLFSGLMGVPTGISKVAGLAMPAAWSFDTMKRFSTLDTLAPEGADPRGKTKGMGLYKYIEHENEKTINRAKKDLEDFRRLTGQQYEFDDTSNQGSDADTLGIGTIQKIPDDLSGYVTFLHPWMDEVRNQIVLMLMFGILVLMTLIVLRLQDV
jgi:ABC-type multidrug transport system ATPase subunit/pSer/pThr/pTyr-binding forkhead associated (FHA) protein